MNQEPIGDSAVVIGASMAGLCAARVLADRFRRVVVFDRDTLPNEPVWRRQVPQGRHPHLLLAGGSRLLEEWFPGLTAELYAGGAVELDLSADLRWHQHGAHLRRPSSPARGPSMSRPFLEWTVRRRLDALPNVEIRSDTSVEGIDLDRDGERVLGVHAADDTMQPCDLVVDASGRRAHSVGWLEAAGHPAPAVSRVEVDTRYVSQELRRTDAPARDWKLAGVVDEPQSKRMAIALPIEGERWLVVFGGLHGEVAPDDLGERRAYARDLPSPEIAQVLDTSEPLGPAVTHRFPASQRRHVDRLDRFPVGWVLLGDAVASFNPIYGQGITSAAQQAAALGRALDRSDVIDRRFAHRYFRAARRVVDVAWSTAVGSDFAYPNTTGPKPRGTDLSNRYTDRVVVAAQRNDAVAVRFAEVVSMVRRPESLMTPPMLFRVMLASCAVRRPNRTRPGRRPS
jgi:2-polyprenyl-6-methoxyphenol hydroxylase-like FAD-dependent oxidoreductase